METHLNRRYMLLLILAIFFAQTCRAEAEKPQESTFTVLEQELELGLHEQLLSVKRDPHSMLTEFTTDGCSGGLSVGWEYLAGKVPQFQAIHGTRPPWESCCVTHDQAYHTGGGQETTAQRSFEARKEADLALQTCILETGITRLPELSSAYKISAREVELLYRSIGDLMYLSVRLGGLPCTGLPWRWGFGWPQCE